MHDKNTSSRHLNGVEWRISSDLIDYEYALSEMEARVKAIHQGQAGELIWLLEHPPLYTAGTSADVSDLVDPERFPVYDAGRGGQYTYHGPGQRVAYFMLDLNQRGKDVRKFVANLEQLIIDVLASFQIKGERRDDRVGVWVDRGMGREEKIAAIGIRIKKWVTLHGIAINVDPDLRHFTGIVPCGISHHGVTSITALGLPVTIEDVDVQIMKSFEKYFSPKAL